MTNPAGRARKANAPYATWTDPRSGWKYKLLKSWQSHNIKPAARWFVDVESEYTHGGSDMGDEYVANLITGVRSAYDLWFDEKIWPDRGSFLRWCMSTGEWA